MGYRMLHCKSCARLMRAYRSDRLTCSAKCRQRYKRTCDQITADAVAAAVFGKPTSVRPAKKGGGK